MDIIDRAREIMEHIYITYGSEAGYLFGIPPKFKYSVQTIVEMALEMAESKDEADKDTAQSRLEEG